MVSVDLFPRRPREPFEVAAPGGKVAVPPPIPVSPVTPRNIAQLVGPLVMVAAVAGVFYVLYTAGLMRYGFFPVIMLVTYGVMFFRRGGSGKKQSWSEGESSRRDWSNKADLAREELAAGADKQFRRARWAHPRPQDLVGLVGSQRMWERRRASVADEFKDFGHVRFGVGTVRQALTVDFPSLPDDVVWVEPASGHGVRKFLQEQRYVRGMPRVVSLPAMKALSLVGPLDEVRALAYAAVCQLCVWHSPEDVKVMVVTARPELWEWVKWLPHAQDSGRRDGCGERRMVFGSAAEFEAYHGEELLDRNRWVPAGGPSQHAAGTDKRPLWVVIDDACGSPADWARPAPPAGVAGVCFVRLAEEAPGPGLGFDSLGFDRVSMYRVGDGIVRRADVELERTGRLRGQSLGDELPFYATADSMTIAEAERVAVSLARFRPGSDVGETGRGVAMTRTLLDAVGVQDARVLDTERLWAQRWTPGRKFWSFPIGIDDEGNLLEMDLKQSADYGWNLNGVIIGHIGSGKSVGIATIVESLVLTHSPEVAVCALFDLKAKSIAQKLEKAPNMLAVVSNLAAERHLIRRMRLALAGLFERRKAAVTAAGCVDLNDYNEKIARGADLPRMPALVVIVDEFNEMLADDPFFDFADRLVRQGRAYHMALTLVGQVYDKNKLRKIDPVLGWKIAMRTGTVETSREVIGDTCAAHLPSRGAEGTGYLRVGADPLKKFRFFNSLEVYVPPAPLDERQVLESGDWFEPREFTATEADDIDGRMAPPAVKVPRPVAPVESLEAGELPLTEAEVVFEAAGGEAVRPLVDFWLPPLQRGLDVDELVYRLRGRAWHESYGANDGLVLPIGQEDRPYDCTQPVLTLDIANQHAAVVGGKQTGVSTALMTAVLGGSLLYDPRRVQFYCVAGGGPLLMSLRHIPHVAGIAEVSNTEGVWRVLESITEIVEFRSKKFVELEISADEFFRRRAADPADLPEITGGQIVLVLDGFASLKAALSDPRDERFLPMVMKIASDGLSVGVHLVVSNDGWGHDFTLGLQKKIDAKLELKLAQTHESQIDRLQNKELPHAPGWGLSPEGNWVRTGLPALTGRDGVRVSDARGLAVVMEDLARVQRAQTMAQLPELVRLEVLQQQAPGMLTIALRERDLRPEVWDFRRSPHLAVLGVRESGRTTVLRSVCRAVMDVFSPEEAELHIIDPRRDLLGTTVDAYTKSYSLTAGAAKEAMANLAARLQERKPPADASAIDALTKRFWEGPEIFVVIDNCELFPHSSPEFPFGHVGVPVAGKDPLYGLAQMGAELGLHIVYSAHLDATYPMASLQNPLWRTVRNMYSPTLILNGDRSLGPIAGKGVRAQAQRPGRGLWVEMDDPHAVLAAWTDPPAQDSLSAGH